MCTCEGGRTLKRRWHATLALVGLGFAHGAQSRSCKHSQFHVHPPSSGNGGGTEVSKLYLNHWAPLFDLPAISAPTPSLLMRLEEGKSSACGANKNDHCASLLERTVMLKTKLAR